MSTPRIAFLGLGLMGGGMARRLLGAGFAVTVFNRTPARAEPLAAAGARVAGSPREAAAGAEVVFSMVADDAASRAMWLGPDGAIAGAARGAVLVECSTLTVAWVQELAQAAAAAGAECIDAPVTGSKNQAAAGELNFLTGGNAAALETIRPALNAMGRSVTHLGPTGSGALLKLINNFLAGVHVAATAEAVAWIERTELDRAQAIAFLSDSAVGSPVTKTVAARMCAPDFTPNFFLRLMAKDLGYASGEAAKAGQQLTSAAMARDVFQRAIAAGHGDKDMSAVVEPLRRR
ncbi:MAG: NAD(P)-dependent oxidoreductase [Verrucomicrobia bacterium]|jgi:3-hydroxyisobutyrate dehydrogenase|nr:NAD(P)-dependent oxidoreductase [Verrucomicrobiota bacterium]